MKEKNTTTNNQRYILTRETLGMTLILFSAIMLLLLVTRDAVFPLVGTPVCTFMYGTFGYGCILVFLGLIYLGVWLVWEKYFKISLSCILTGIATVLMLFLLFHSVSARSIPTESFGEFVSLCYNNASLGFSGYTFGGVLSAMLVYPVAKATTFIGAYVIFSVLTLVSAYFLCRAINVELDRQKASKINSAKVENATNNTEVNVAPNGQTELNANLLRNAYGYGINSAEELFGNIPPAPVQNAQVSQNEDKFSAENLGSKILFKNGEFAAESYRRNMIFNENSYFNNPVHNEGDYLSNFGLTAKKNNGETDNGAESVSYTESYRQSLDENAGRVPSGYVFGDKPVDNLNVGGVSQGVYRGENLSENLIDGTFNSAETNFGNNSYSNENEFIDEDESEEVLFTENNPVEIDADNFDEPINSDEFSEDFNGFEENIAQDDRIQNFNSNETYAREHGFGEYAEADGNLLQPRTEINSDDSVLYGNDLQNVRRDNSLSETGGRGSNDLRNLFSTSNPNLQTRGIELDASRIASRAQVRSNANFLDDDGEEEEEVIPPTENTAVNTTDNRVIDENRREKIKIVPPTENQVNVEPPRPKHVWKKYVAPSLDLLRDYSEFPSSSAAEIEANKQAIVENLLSARIECEVVNVIVGARFTRYDVKILNNAAMKNALARKDVIQIALRKDTINAYVNFKLAVLSIEVPNSESGIVGLRSMIASSAFLNAKPNSLTFALGKNIEGEHICPDITKMPHLLVAGTTGSGKSICLSSLIVSLLYRYGPEELRFILVDPKQVEFVPYDNLPHLMINEIINDVDKTIKALNWAIKEMERRYQLFKEMSENGMLTKDLTEYNNHLPDGEEKLPKIVIILDEFGDLMIQAKKEIEQRIVRLVQKARACGIHLILATQRPDKDTITGLIKSNLPTRIGFRVNSYTDSGIIFDVKGAENLLGSGDMYYRSPNSTELWRVQGCFIASPEVQKVTDFIRANNETYFDQTVSDFINTVEVREENNTALSEEIAPDADNKIDDTFIKALHYCVTSNQASVSMIQRRFPIGYIKACKIIDWMENMNYITQSEGSKPRKVLLSKEEFINTYGEIDD